MNKLILKNKVSQIPAGTFILPKFAKKIHNILSFKHKETYIVGGAVRNFFLKKKITDIDIATSATPKQVITLLKKNSINFSAQHEKMGVIVASEGKHKIEVTTFRTETYHQNRFPKVKFTKSIKQDSQRRDFTINALYFSPELNQVLDFHNGLRDIKKQTLRFVGNPEKRIQEDPLRVVRAYRFALQSRLKIESKTAQGLQKNLHLIKTISKTRLQKEINVVKPKSLRKTLQKVIHSNT